MTSPQTTTAPKTAVRAAPAKPVSPRRGGKWRYAGTVAVFLLPSAIPLMLYTIIPMLGSLWTSLHEWDLITDMHWVGLGNYAELLSDPQTLTAFGNTLYFIAGYLPLVYAGGLGLALLLNRAMRGRSLLRGIYFLPVITSWVVVALMWKWLLNPASGLVNWALGLVGISGPGWWTDPDWAMPSVILASAWKDLGFVMVILLAGLQAIPKEYQEAALVDGASAWQRFRRITLPLLSPSTFFVVVISLINGFQVFDQVRIMAGGNAQVVVTQIYDLTFRYGRAGMASALSWLLFAFVLIVTAVQIRAQRRWVTYG
ncbi:carbohydrate ABC transporter permease [Nonomuraea endophytica]|uniref:Multiple sugar transport system permease protein n=1 Tax=Nonomuraea endophytica TaxID=714136 RepID=A0A7W8AF67_9ACTN|nr:sugar ABC transporter permease [Nonomuraea endophytica]MBB5085003.1 multiple sugar transport system permease protein [Nonomuraea endophytica]